MATLTITIDANSFRAEDLGPAVQALRAGQVVAMPTETVYGLAVRPDDPDARRRLDSLKGRNTDKPLTRALASRDLAGRLLSMRPPGLRRLADRFWPGPLTIVGHTPDGTSLGVRVPAHRVATALLDQFPEGLWLTSANAAGAPPAVDAQSVHQSFPEGLGAVVDAGAAPLGEASALVSFKESRTIIHRSNVIDPSMIWNTAATHVLLVCSGNTCRSPMAEALFRSDWAKSLGVDPEQLLEHGGRVSSAGTGALPGITATTEAATAVGERGLSIKAHRSTPLTREQIASAHRIFGMTSAHVEAVVQMEPAARDRTGLLRPDGANVADPFGGDLPTYRACCAQLQEVVAQRVQELVAELAKQL